MILVFHVFDVITDHMSHNR